MSNKQIAFTLMLLGIAACVFSVVLFASVSLVKSANYNQASAIIANSRPTVWEGTGESVKTFDAKTDKVVITGKQTGNGMFQFSVKKDGRSLTFFPEFCFDNCTLAKVYDLPQTGAYQVEIIGRGNWVVTLSQ